MTLAAKITGLNAANVGLMPWHPVPLHRVYDRTYPPEAFNASPSGNARFSPLQVVDPAATSGMRVVPTMYAGVSLDVALMEVVLRDVPLPSAGHIHRMKARSKENRRVTRLTVTAGGPSGTLSLADLTGPGLHRLGLTRTEVVECEATLYPDTRKLGAWIYQQVPTAQGIIWTSRQHGSQEALMFFGDRVPAGSFSAVQPDQELTSGPVLGALVALLGQLGAGLHIDP